MTGLFDDLPSQKANAFQGNNDDSVVREPPAPPTAARPAGAPWTPISPISEPSRKQLNPAGLVGAAKTRSFASSVNPEGLVVLAVAMVIIGATVLVTVINPNWQAGGFLFIILMIASLTGLRLLRGSARTARLASYGRMKEPKKVNDRLTEQLVEDERYRITVRFHPVKEIKWWLGLTAWIITTITVRILFELPLTAVGIALLAGLAVCGIPLYQWSAERFCLTNTRVFVLEGVFNKRYPMMPISRITDYEMKMSFWSRLLAQLRIIDTPYGYLIAESPGQDQALHKIGPLPEINAIHKQVVSLILKPEVEPD